MEEEDIEAVAHGGQVEVDPDSLAHGTGLGQEGLGGGVEVNDLAAGEGPRPVHDAAGQRPDARVGGLREGASSSQVGCEVAVDLDTILALALLKDSLSLHKTTTCSTFAFM